MPTDPRVFGAVAQAVGSVDPKDGEAVAGFYRQLTKRNYSPGQRDLVFGFLLASETLPNPDELKRLAELFETAGRPAPANTPSRQAPRSEAQLRSEGRA